MGDKGLKGVVTASLFGIPLPLCSCSIIPVSVALRKKGASLPAIQSFLISTPETGVDSIFVTWAVLGPIMAIIRPVASFFTALCAGIFTIGIIRQEEPKPIPIHNSAEHTHDHSHGCCEGHDHGQDFEEDTGYVGFNKICASLKWSIIRSWYNLRSWRLLNSWYKPEIIGEKYVPPHPPMPDAEGVPHFSKICKKMMRFSCIELTDDLALPLLIGIFLSGIILTFFPSDLSAYGMSDGFLPYFVMLAAGIPIYMCATASTPIAASLVAKGISPGAGLVFLLSGPATNATALTMLLQQFGSRFVSIYLGSIAVCSLLSGLALDFLLIKTGWQIAPSLEFKGDNSWTFIMWTCGIFLAILIAWRFANGAFKVGYKTLAVNLQPFVTPITKPIAAWIQNPTRFHQCLHSPKGTSILCIVILLYIASGFATVPPGARGYARICKKVYAKDLQPGLHYALPWPFGAIDVFQIEAVRRLTVGTKQTTSPTAVHTNTTDKKNLSFNWHPSGSWKIQKTPQAEYLAGDENLVNLIFTVQYKITNGYNYFYQVENPEIIIDKYLQAVSREYVATSKIDPLLNHQRTDFENFTMGHLQDHIDSPKHFQNTNEHTLIQVNHNPNEKSHNIDHVDDKHIDHHNLNKETENHDLSGNPDNILITKTDTQLVNSKKSFAATNDRHLPNITQTKKSLEKGLGIQIISVSLVDVHPPQEAATAFRDVSSAKEDRETYRLKSLEYYAKVVPRARGNAAIETMVAKANSIAEAAIARGSSSSLISQAAVVKDNRSILQDLLWFESSERALENKKIFIFPHQVTPQDFVVWRKRERNNKK